MRCICCPSGLENGVPGTIFLPDIAGDEPMLEPTETSTPCTSDAGSG